MRRMYLQANERTPDGALMLAALSTYRATPSRRPSSIYLRRDLAMTPTGANSSKDPERGHHAFRSASVGQLKRVVEVLGRQADRIIPCNPSHVAPPGIRWGGDDV